MYKLKIVTEAHGIRRTIKKRSDQQMEGNDKLKIAIKAHDNRMKNEKRSENV